MKRFNNLLTLDLLKNMHRHFLTEKKASNSSSTFSDISELLAIQKILFQNQFPLLTWVGHEKVSHEKMNEACLEIKMNEEVIYWTFDHQLILKKDLNLKYINESSYKKTTTLLDFKKDLNLKPFFNNDIFSNTAAMLEKQGLGMHFFLNHPKKFEIEKFIETLKGFDCHEKIGQSIGDTLLEKQERVTTTRFHLLEQWGDIQNQLNVLGVEIVRTFPQTKPVESQNKKALSLEDLQNSVMSLKGQHERRKLKR